MSVLALVALLVALAALRAPVRPLDPTSTAPSGTRALARVLTATRGTTVEPVRDAAALRGATVDADTTIVVADPGTLSQGAAADLARVAARAGRLVLLDPDDTALRALGVPARSAGRAALPLGHLRGSCVADDVGPDDEVDDGADMYRPTGDVPGSATCLRAGDDAAPRDPRRDTPRDDAPGDAEGREGDESAAAPAVPRAAAGDRPAGAYLLLPATNGTAPSRGGTGDASAPSDAGAATRPETVVLGLGRRLDNVSIPTSGEDATAAIALRTLGHTGRVLWYLPSAGDGAPLGSEREIGGALPPAAGPATIVGLGALVAFCLWRGRRLGRLVPEPLPAVVPAVETVRARARLYARSGDADHALALLTDGTLTRLRRRLRLPPGASAEAVADRVAAHLGAPPDRVRAVLAPPAGAEPVTPGTLPAHLAQLRRLEREVDQA